MFQIEWGNTHAHFTLETESPVVAELARDVFEPWSRFDSERRFGPWRVVECERCWRIDSPQVTQPLIERYELPSTYQSPAEAVKAIEFRAVGASLLLPGSPPGFHGALLSRGEKTFGLVGGKEVGKSTLAAALWQHGFQLYCDDGFQLDPEYLATPVTRRSRLRGTSRPLFSAEVWRAIAQSPTCFEELDGGLLYHSHKGYEPKPLRAIIVLQAGPGELVPLEESEAVMECVIHSHTYHSAGLGESIAELAELSNMVKCFKLGRGTLQSRMEQIEMMEL